MHHVSFPEFPESNEYIYKNTKNRKNKRCLSFSVHLNDWKSLYKQKQLLVKQLCQRSVPIFLPRRNVKKKEVKLDFILTFDFTDFTILLKISNFQEWKSKTIIENMPGWPKQTALNLVSYTHGKHRIYWCNAAYLDVSSKNNKKNMLRWHKQNSLPTKTLNTQYLRKTDLLTQINCNTILPTQVLSQSIQEGKVKQERKVKQQ